MRILTFPPAPRAPVLPNGPGVLPTPSAPPLADDDHMDLARIDAVVGACRLWRDKGALSGAPLVALSSDVAVAVLDIVIAQLTTRAAGVALANSAPRDRDAAMMVLRSASQQVVATVDRLIDLDAQHRVAVVMQQRQQVLSAPASRRTEVRHA